MISVLLIYRSLVSCFCPRPLTIADLGSVNEPIRNHLINNIAPLGYIRMFFIGYLTIHKVHMHAGAISQLLYGLCAYTGDNPRAKARGLSSRTYAQTVQIPTHIV